MRLWDRYPSWDEAESQWDKASIEAEKNQAVKKISRLPNIPGMTEDTARFFQVKAMYYLITRDKGLKLIKALFKHPARYLSALVKSLLSKKSYQRDEDFFFYGIENTEEFKKEMKHTEAIFVLGFSYCQKPFECPSGRFTDECIHELTHDVCKQCFIGKCVHALPDNRETLPLFIPTVHYIGEKMFELREKQGKRPIHFLITACEMTLKMFGDWGNMLNIRGIGVRLDGRICNTMRAFELSEEGIKPGLTVVVPKTERRMLDLLKYLREET